MSEVHSGPPVPGPDNPPEPPSWLPGGRGGERAKAWWAHLARAVEALTARYPRHLRELPPDWFAEPALSEPIGALCAWRLAIDTGLAAPTPRAELEFHRALDRLRELLDARGQAALVGRPEHPQAPVPRAEQLRAADARQEALQRASQSWTGIPANGLVGPSGR